MARNRLRHLRAMARRWRKRFRAMAWVRVIVPKNKIKQLFLFELHARIQYLSHGLESFAPPPSHGVEVARAMAQNGLRWSGCDLRGNCDTRKFPQGEMVPLVFGVFRFDLFFFVFFRSDFCVARTAFRKKTVGKNNNNIVFKFFE